ELSVLYEAFRRGEGSPLAELSLQYGDFAEWQRNWLQGEELEGQLRFWTSRLEGTQQRASLPLDRPRTQRVGRQEERHRFELPVEASATLESMARGHGVTLFMLLLAAVQTLLWRYGGGEELVVVGTPIAGRNRLETEPLIGFFVNTLVLAQRLGDDPGFSGLLGRTREEVLSAFAHQDMPFEKLVEEIAPQRDASRTPLFDVLFALQNVEVPSVELPELRMAPLQGQGGAAKFDLSLVLGAGERGIGGGFSYDTCLFELFAQVAREQAEAPAIVTAEGEVWSYRRLDEESNRLARRLRDLGVVAESAVGLCMERSAELILGMLSILKAGGVYVPLDASYPEERLAFMLADTGARLVVVQEGTRSRIVAPEGVRTLCVDLDRDGIVACSAERLSLHVPAAGLAYVIYTSGSTGEPKGVAVPHQAIVRLVRETDYVQLGRGDRVAHLSNTSFDAATFEIWGALLNGSAVVVVPRDVALVPADLAGLLRRQRVTAL